MTEDRNKQYCNTVKDLLLPNTINQKDEKPHTAGLNECKLPKYRLKKSSIPLQYRKKNWQIPKYRVINRRNTDTAFIFGHAYLKVYSSRVFVYLKH